MICSLKLYKRVIQNLLHLTSSPAVSLEVILIHRKISFSMYLNHLLHASGLRDIVGYCPNSQF